MDQYIKVLNNVIRNKYSEYKVQTKYKIDFGTIMVGALLVPHDNPFGGVLLTIDKNLKDILVDGATAISLINASTIIKD